jgi:hypothetical protein
MDVKDPHMENQEQMKQADPDKFMEVCSIG